MPFAMFPRQAKEVRSRRVSVSTAAARKACLPCQSGEDGLVRRALSVTRRLRQIPGQQRLLWRWLGSPDTANRLRKLDSSAELLEKETCRECSTALVDHLGRVFGPNVAANCAQSRDRSWSGASRRDCFFLASRLQCRAVFGVQGPSRDRGFASAGGFLC